MVFPEGITLELFAELAAIGFPEVIVGHCDEGPRVAHPSEHSAGQLKYTSRGGWAGTHSSLNIGMRNLCRKNRSEYSGENEEGGTYLLE